MDNRLPGYVRRFERFCSMAVRHLLDDIEQLYPSIIKGYRHILTVCSICSAFLYLTGHTELFFSEIRDKGQFFSYGRWRGKVSNKSNRIENIISIPYIYWFSSVRPFRTSIEHMSNTVRRSVEQQHEHHRLFHLTVPNDVRQIIWSGSIMFDSNPNRATPNTTKALVVFAPAVRFVRPVFTPPAQSHENEEQSCLNK